VINEETRRALEFTDRLHMWLGQEAAALSPEIVATALTYELARHIAATARLGVDHEKHLAVIVGLMRQQINAHLNGRQRGV
jgi:hypothetical protein